MEEKSLWLREDEEGRKSVYHCAQKEAELRAVIAVGHDGFNLGIRKQSVNCL